MTITEIAGARGQQARRVRVFIIPDHIAFAGAVVAVADDTGRLVGELAVLQGLRGDRHRVDELGAGTLDIVPVGEVTIGVGDRGRRRGAHRSGAAFEIRLRLLLFIGRRVVHALGRVDLTPGLVFAGWNADLEACA